jgi:hypothetical protein
VSNFFRSNFGLSFCCAQERQNSRVSISQAILEIRPETIIRDQQGAAAAAAKPKGQVTRLHVPAREKLRAALELW